MKDSSRLTTAITDKQLKTALVYDRVNTSHGGAEQVLLALQHLFPQAPLYTSVYDRQKAKWAQSFTVKTSFLQNWPGAKTHHRCFLPLMPLAFEQLDLSDYDVVVSVSSAEAKGVITKPHQIHINYMLTPPRYLYSHKKEYLQSRSWLNLPIINGVTRQLLRYQTWWDQVAVYRPDVIVPLSKLVKARAKQYYQLEINDPIYPPVDMVNFNLTLSKHHQQQLKAFALPDKFCLIVSRLVNYKRIDVAINACDKLGLNLIIIGEGPDKKRLNKLARTKTNSTYIKLIGSQPQAIVNNLMKQAMVVLSLGVEDFGLAPLQANLLGTPAIVNDESGMAEVVKNNGAVKIKDLSAKTIISALQTVVDRTWNKTDMKINAQKYTRNRFLFKFKNVLTSLVSGKS